MTRSAPAILCNISATSSRWMHFPGVFFQHKKQPTQGAIDFLIKSIRSYFLPIPSKNALLNISVLLASPLGDPFRSNLFMCFFLHIRCNPCAWVKPCAVFSYKQTVSVAVCIDKSVSEHPEICFAILFRIKLQKLCAPWGDVFKERDIKCSRRIGCHIVT